MALDIETSWYTNLWATVKNEYPKIDEDRLYAEIARLRAVAPKLSQLQGLTILDIWSWAKESPDSPDIMYPSLVKRIPIIGKLLPKDTTFEPWYCRIAHLGWAHVFGIDIWASKDEPYEHIQADLFPKNSLLEAIPSDILWEIDVINNYKFTAEKDSKHAPLWASPHIVFGQIGMQESGGKDSDGFVNWLDYGYLWRLNESVRSQVVTLLKKGWLYTHGEFVYKKSPKWILERIRIIKGLGS